MKIFHFVFILLISSNLFSKDTSYISTSDTTLINLSNTVDSIVSPSQKIYVTLNSDSNKSWLDWLPIIVALIVAFLAYFSAIKQSKASSITGFRVKWIEDLRINYSKFLIVLKNVDNKVRLKIIDPKKYSKDEDVEELNFLKTKIKLMLNHNESEHIEFWEAFTQYMYEHNKYYKGKYSEEIENNLDNMRVQMEELLLAIFKKEWDKAKKFD